MSWITDDWRLKLAALALAVLMLAAVAFSQNPPTSNTLPVPLTYTSVGSDPTNPLVIINPPSTVNVTFTGLGGVVHDATSDNFSATVDATRAAVGQAVKLNISVTPTVAVNITPPAPIVVRIDRLVQDTLQVTAHASGAPGWVVKSAVATPATVTFTGPLSWEDHLTANVSIATPINIASSQQLNQPIVLSNSNGTLSLSTCTTRPCASLDVGSVAVTVTAASGASSTAVVLVPDVPTQLPPAGYQITSVSVSPVQVTVTGDPAVLGKLHSITLPKVDLSSYKGTAKISVNIPYPDGVSPLNGIQTATITYTIERNPVVSPAPSPS